MHAGDPSRPGDAPGEDPGIDLDGVRPPQQDRSRRTLDRIVTAALDLVAERGVRGTSVHDIVARAGSSVGSFYARFDGKQDLVRYLERRVWAEATERWERGMEEGAWAGADLPDLVAGIVDLLLRIERTDAAGRRALAEERPGDGSSPGAEFRRRVSRDVRALLLRHSDGITHPDPELAVDFALEVLVAFARSRRPSAADPPTRSEIGRMIVAYLQAPGDAGPDRGETTVDFFDVWA